jgi:hypothetical protein
LKPYEPPQLVPVSRDLWFAEHILSQTVRSSSPKFSQAILISSHAAQLPDREDPTHPNEYEPGVCPSAMMDLASSFGDEILGNTFLALYNTPLHDLLSIVGDGWVFGEKVTPPSAFQSAQSRLKSWSSSPTAAIATLRACRVLRTAISVDAGTENVECISDWWAIYTSVLICWAFGKGHRFQSFADPTIEEERFSFTDTVMNAGDMNIGSEVKQEDAMRPSALRYVSAILKSSAEDLLTSKATSRGHTAAVISVVRVRLEEESAGCKSGLLLDAVSSLKKIEQGGRQKCF